VWQPSPSTAAHTRVFRAPRIRADSRSVAAVAPARDARATRSTTARGPMAAGKLLAVWLVNKSGGLIYHRALREDAPTLDANACLRLASVWHSLHAISRKVAPVTGCAGIESLECDTFDLYCFQAETGMKIFVTMTKGSADASGTLRRTHRAYCDYALKNPFYEVEMPVRCELFDVAIADIARSVNERG
jgi:hypothetical protein|tara:strand:+ start:6045 stop:6611 length:567 start_codon:yes stop_codon:yes gene_type:complete